MIRLPSNSSSYLPASATIPFVVTTELKDVDVLLGRGTGPNTWIGNLMFRDLVHHAVEAYNSIANKDGEEQHSIIIVKTIISKVHERGGRFLRKLASIKKKKNQAGGGGGGGAYHHYGIDISNDVSSFAGVAPACRSSNNAKESIYEIVTDMKILIGKTKQAMRYSKKSKASDLSSSAITARRLQHYAEQPAPLQAAFPSLEAMKNSSPEGSIDLPRLKNPFLSINDTVESSKPTRKDSSAVGAVAAYASEAKNMESRPHSPSNACDMMDNKTLPSPSRSVAATRASLLPFISERQSSSLRVQHQSTDPILRLVAANLRNRSVSNANHDLSDILKRERSAWLGRQCSQEGNVMFNNLTSQQQALAASPSQAKPAHLTSIALSRLANTVNNGMLLEDSLLQCILRSHRSRFRRAVEARNLLDGQNNAVPSIREGVRLLESLRGHPARTAAPFLKTTPSRFGFTAGDLSGSSLAYRLANKGKP